MTMDEIKGRKVAIDIVKANVFAVVIMVVAAVAFLIPFFLIWKVSASCGNCLLPIAIAMSQCTSPAICVEP